MGLQQFWFVVVAVLFLGFFVLEGFDFGVGMLMACTLAGSRARAARQVTSALSIPPDRPISAFLKPVFRK